MEETWRQARPIVFAGVILIGVVLGLLLFLQLQNFFAVLFLGIVLGLALNPVVDTLAKLKVPRVASVLLVYLLVALVFAGMIYLAFLEISNETFDLELEALRQDYDELQEGTLLPTSEEIEGYAEVLFEQISGGLIGQAFTFVGALFNVFSILVFALLFTITQGRMRLAFLSLLPPENRRQTTEVMDRMAIGVRGFIRGQFVAMVAVGLITYIGLTLLGVRLAVLLAFIAFAMEILPIVGPWIAFFPAFVVAITDGFWLAAQVSLLYLFIQQFESYVVAPLVLGREGRIPALLILSAILIGGSLYGVMGALMALPMAVILHIFYFEVIIPWTEKRYRSPAPVNEPERWIKTD